MIEDNAVLPFNRVPIGSITHLIQLCGFEMSRSVLIQEYKLGAFSNGLEGFLKRVPRGLVGVKDLLQPSGLACVWLVAPDPEVSLLNASVVCHRQFSSIRAELIGNEFFVEVFVVPGFIPQVAGLVCLEALVAEDEFCVFFAH